MNSLINMSQEQIMGSLDFRNMVNEARKAAGEKPIRNTHFLERVEDELKVNYRLQNYGNRLLVVLLSAITT